MKYLPVLLLLGALLLACQPVEEAPDNTITCPDGTVVSNPSECVTEEQLQPETTPEPEEEVVKEPAKATADIIFGSDEIPTQPVSADAEAFLSRAADKTKNGYSFMIIEAEAGIPTSVFYQGALVYKKDDMYALDWEKKRRDDLRVGDEFFTYVVVNKADELAEAFCLDRCTDKGPFSASTSFVDDLPEPLEWLYIISEVEELGSQSVDGRNAMRINAKIGDEPVEMYVDTFSGVPIKVIRGENVLEYKSLGLGVNEEVFNVLQ